VQVVSATVITVLASLFLHFDAQACAVCFSSSENTRAAFYLTTAFLTALPVVMLIGGFYWVRKLQQKHDAVDQS
jgi:hypothetical protein